MSVEDFINTWPEKNNTQWYEALELYPPTVTHDESTIDICEEFDIDLDQMYLDLLGEWEAQLIEELKDHFVLITWPENIRQSANLCSDQYYELVRS